MKRMEGFLSFLLVLSILNSLLSCVVKTDDPEAFLDLSSLDWHFYYDWYSIQESFFQGTSVRRFEPERDLRRSEAVAVLGRVHEKITGQTIPQSFHAVYPDVSVWSYYGRYVNWAQENGLTALPPGEPFRPKGTVTNEEMAVLLCRYLHFLDPDRTCDPKPIQYLTGTQASPWAEEALRELSGCGLFRTAVLFDPQGVVSRGAAAKMFVRMYQKLTYPIDRETPRLKYGHYEKSDEQLFWPLEDGETRIIRDYPAFRSLVEQLPSNSKLLKEEPLLSVGEDTFRDHGLLAVYVSVDRTEEGRISCEVKDDRAKAVFVSASSGKYSDEPILGYLYFLQIPNNVTEVQAEEYWWVNDVMWTASG